MEPTPRADALIGTARAAIESLQRLTEREQDFVPATVQRRFRICMTDASHVTLLPQLFERLRLEAPAVRIEAVQIGPNTAHALQTVEADLALGLIPELDSGFYQQTLYAQDWVCLANPKHPRIGATLSRAEYAAEARVTRRVLLELPGFLGLAAIVQSTDLVATLPRHTGETLAQASGLCAALFQQRVAHAARS
jgi:DNA-binding transcriptional LysR family regulator